MKSSPCVYFDKPGLDNTLECAAAAAKRATELGIRHIVIASNSGDTSLKMYDTFKDLDCSIVSVTEHAGFKGGDDSPMVEANRVALEKKGVAVVMCSHALSGVERSISAKLGGVSRVELIAHILRLFGGEGIKVAVEIAIMAADTGAIPTNREIIAIGGTNGGADTAIVLKPAHMNNFFDLEIREIIAKPRQRKSDV